MATPKITDLIKRISSLEQQLSSSGEGGLLKAILPDGSQPSVAHMKTAMPVVLAAGNNQPLLQLEEVVKEREDKAYQNGMMAGIAVMGMIGAVVLIKMFNR